MSLVKKLMKHPKRDKGIEETHIIVLNPEMSQQADLLFMPDDRGYKYILVVVDLNSRICDAEPLKNKESKNILNAFKTIYKRKILNMPKVDIQFDDGTEFKGVVKDYFNNHNVRVKYALPSRHRQMGMVERRNQLISVHLFEMMHAREMVGDEINGDWVDDLGDVIKLLNKKAKKNNENKIELDDELKGTGKMLEIGDKVRAVLDAPIDSYSGAKKLHGKFRSVDIKWNPEQRLIKDIILTPNQPPLYVLDGPTGKLKIDSRVAYTKNQLQIVDENEQVDQNHIKKQLNNKNQKWKVEAIEGEKTINKKLHYYVKWSGFNRKHNTYEPATEIKNIRNFKTIYDKYKNAL